ncbi:DUF1850 domain-containing protein [Bacillaceae bacterium W0354]
MKRRLLLSIFLIIVIICLIVIDFEVLIVESNDDIVHLIKLDEDEPFSIRWIHSVEKEEWEEYFVFKKDELVIQKTRFKTFGAGVPNDAGEKTYIRDGWVYMDDINQPLGKTLSIRSGQTTNHRMFYKGKEYSLPYSASPYTIAKDDWSLMKLSYFYITRIVR